MSGLKIHTGNQELIDGVKVSEVFRSIGDIKFSPSMSDRKCLVVARAVRDYDSNQELIAKLQADNELLRDLLAEVMHDECGAEQHLGETTCDRITLALAATAKG